MGDHPAPISKKKPVLTRDGLKQHGIECEPQLLRTTDGLPQHVASRVSELLHFKKKVHVQYRTSLEEELSALTGSTFDDSVDGSAWKLSIPPEDDEDYWTLSRYADKKDRAYQDTLEKTMNHCHEIAQQFKHMGRDSESTWTHRLISDIFQRYDRTETDMVGSYHTFEEWCLEENKLWSAQPRLGALASGGEVTLPKPDLTYAYPLFRPNEKDRFSMWEGMACHSTRLIKLLAGRGVTCTLTTAVLDTPDGTAAFGELRKPDLTAFPWAIVEVKPDDAPKAKEDFCVDQAANASAAAVRIFKSLWDYCGVSARIPIPPVVAYTCIGARVKVWMTFFDPASNKTRMVCVWSADLTTVWGVCSIQMVVENMRAWALNPLRAMVNIALWDSGAKLHQESQESGHSAERLQRPQGSRGGEAESARGIQCDSSDDSSPRTAGLDTPATPPGSSSNLTTALEGASVGEESRVTVLQYKTPTAQNQGSQRLPSSRDSGIGTDIRPTPTKTASARSLRYQTKTGSAAREHHSEPFNTPSKAFSDVDDSQDALSLASADIDPFVSSAVPARSTAGGSGSHQATEGTISTPSRITNDEDPPDDAEYADDLASLDQTSRSYFASASRPSTRRKVSDRAAKALSEGRTYIDKNVVEMLDYVKKHGFADYPDLSQMMAHEASTHGGLAAGPACIPTRLADSPVQTPLQESPAPERDVETNSTRTSTSGRRRLFSRHGSSSSGLRSGTPLSPSRNNTDASSEMSVASSRAESLKQRTLEHADAIKARAQASWENTDVRGVVGNVTQMATYTLTARFAAHRATGKGGEEGSESSAASKPASQEEHPQVAPDGLRRDEGSRDGVQAVTLEDARSEGGMPGAWVEK